MSDMAATVTNEQDLLDISAYFSSRAKMKGDVPVINENGRALFFVEGNGCINCHGVNGKGLASDNPAAPVIGGQHKDYLVKQMKDFRSGSRSNDPGNIMGWITSQLSDSDIEDVASYISGL
jgi:cytochrome c553